MTRGEHTLLSLPSSFTFAQHPPLIPCPDWSWLMLHLHKKLEPKGKTQPLPWLVLGSWLICMGHNQSSPRNHQRGSNKMYEEGNWRGMKETGWVHSYRSWSTLKCQEYTACLINPACLSCLNLSFQLLATIRQDRGIRTDPTSSRYSKTLPKDIIRLMKNMNKFNKSPSLKG